MDLSWLSPHPRTSAEQFLCHALDAAREWDVPLWLYGGYALEVLVGRPLREHQDVDLLARAEDGLRLSAALASCEYAINGFCTASLNVYAEGQRIADLLLVEEHPEGFPVIRGPVGANPLPPGSLTDGPVIRMWGRPVRVVTLECLYVMKASGNFMDAGAPPSRKHEEDLALIRSRLPAETIEELARYCRLVELPGRRYGVAESAEEKMDA